MVSILSDSQGNVTEQAINSLCFQLFLEAANKTRRRTKRINREYQTADTGLWAEPSASHLSSSSSSSAASSAGGKEPGNQHTTDEIRQSGQKRGSKSSSRSSSGSSASSRACSSSSQEDHSGDRHCSGDSEYPNQQVIHSGWTFLYFL